MNFVGFVHPPGCRAGIAVPGPNVHVAEASKGANGEGRAKRQRTESVSDPVSPGGPATQMEKDTSGGASAMDTTDVTLGFGTLTIDVENRSRYVGPSGGAAYLNSDLWKLNPGPPHSRENSEDYGASSIDSSAVRGLVRADEPNRTAFLIAFSQ